jgi:hypothetical protein
MCRGARVAVQDVFAGLIDRDDPWEAWRGLMVCHFVSIWPAGR